MSELLVKRWKFVNHAATLREGIFTEESQVRDFLKSVYSKGLETVGLKSKISTKI